MPVLIDQSLPAHVSKLDSNDARRVWGFLAKFIDDPAHPSLSLERVNQAKSDDLWSGRISQALRAIIHKEGDTWTVLYAGQHDQSYDWARRRQIGRHPATGALQIVELPESVEQELPPKDSSEALGLFDDHQDDYLISLGLPPNWVPTIRRIRSEDMLFQVLPKLPIEVQERLVAVAAGELVTPPPPLQQEQPAIASQDTKRRFYLLEKNEDLLKLLDAPLATWIAFLHPSQQKLATGSFNGPLKITGSAGTGKTVVAMHRARHLARQGKRVLLTSFVTTLCENLRQNLQLLCTPEELSLITVATVHSQALSLLNQAGKSFYPIKDEDFQQLIETFYNPALCPLAPSVLLSEWQTIIQDQGIRSWEEYRKANRAGRGIPLSAKDRKQVWAVFQRVLDELNSKGARDWSGLCFEARELLEEEQTSSPFDAIIVDELQDLRPQELQLLATLAGEGQDKLTLVGDSGQRIYVGRSSLSSLGINVRGRSHILRINYRTTEEIRSFAEKILGNISDETPGDQKDRKGTVSLLRGPIPILRGFERKADENQFVVDMINGLMQVGLYPEEIAIFSRSSTELESLQQNLHSAGIPSQMLSKKTDKKKKGINLGTMHRAKGLEFKAVFVVDASNKQLPKQSFLQSIVDPQLRLDALERERHLFYVSLTRARDEVFVTWVGEQTDFLAPHL